MTYEKKRTSFYLALAAELSDAVCLPIMGLGVARTTVFSRDRLFIYTRASSTPVVHSFFSLLSRSRKVSEDKSMATSSLEARGDKRLEFWPRQIIRDTQ